MACGLARLSPSLVLLSFACASPFAKVLCAPLSLQSLFPAEFLAKVVPRLWIHHVNVAIKVRIVPLLAHVSDVRNSPDVDVRSLMAPTLGQRRRSHGEQPLQQTSITPQALLDHIKRSGLFDHLRKELLAEFKSSDDGRRLIQKLDETFTQENIWTKDKSCVRAVLQRETLYSTVWLGLREQLRERKRSVRHMVQAKYQELAQQLAAASACSPKDSANLNSDRPVETPLVPERALNGTPTHGDSARSVASGQGPPHFPEETLEAERCRSGALGGNRVADERQPEAAPGVGHHGMMGIALSPGKSDVKTRHVTFPQDSSAKTVKGEPPGSDRIVTSAESSVYPEPDTVEFWSDSDELSDPPSDLSDSLSDLSSDLDFAD